MLVPREGFVHEDVSCACPRHGLCRYYFFLLLFRFGVYMEKPWAYDRRPHPGSVCVSCLRPDTRCAGGHFGDLFFFPAAFPLLSAPRERRPYLAHAFSSQWAGGLQRGLPPFLNPRQQYFTRASIPNSGKFTPPLKTYADLYDP
jgi:hypothetical protein